MEDIVRKLGYEVVSEEVNGKPAEAAGNIAELKLRVIGMDNPHCVSTVDNALKTLNGIISKELLQNEKAAIRYDSNKLNFSKIAKRIKSVGYEAVEERETLSGIDREKEARQREIKHLRNDFIFALAFSVPIFALSLLLYFPKYL